MKIKAIVFDLDGTLLDTLDDLTAALGHALGALSYAALDKARVRRYVGNGVPRLIERALYFLINGVDPKSDSETIGDRELFDACLSVFTEYYDKHNADFTKPYEGVSEMLAAAKCLGLKTAIVTNKYDGAARALKDKFFSSVDVVVGAQDGIRPKPAPDGVKKALELIGVDKSQAVYVGDGETDMKTANNCGIVSVAVTWGFRDRAVLDEYNPNFVIDKPSELFDALKSHGLLD
ncbi:MAG: HAD-IA family hydrolase [Clostridiales bacterium]|nr:HAD-IA family hydrolase [Clostridiales bacterium]